MSFSYPRRSPGGNPEAKTAVLVVEQLSSCVHLTIPAVPQVEPPNLGIVVCMSLGVLSPGLRPESSLVRLDRVIGERVEGVGLVIRWTDQV